MFASNGIKALLSGIVYREFKNSRSGLRDCGLEHIFAAGVNIPPCGSLEHLKETCQGNRG